MRWNLLLGSGTEYAGVNMVSFHRDETGSQHKILTVQALLNVAILKPPCSILLYLANHNIANKLLLLTTFKTKKAEAL